MMELVDMVDLESILLKGEGSSPSFDKKALRIINSTVECFVYTETAEGSNPSLFTLALIKKLFSEIFGSFKFIKHLIKFSDQSPQKQYPVYL